MTSWSGYTHVQDVYQSSWKDSKGQGIDLATIQKLKLAVPRNIVGPTLTPKREWLVTSSEKWDPADVRAENHCCCFLRDSHR